MQEVFMFFTSRPVQRLLQAAGLVCSVAVVVACGGGGSPEPLAPAMAAADRATAYAAGPITGFGSIIVNGVRYDDSAASITDDDGASHRPERLKLGMVVEVDAQGVDRVAAQGKALKVRFGAQLVGPAAGPLTADNSLTVLGQKIQVTATTVVDDALVGGLAAVTAGTVLEVHGLVDTATGGLLATRIEAQPDATSYRLKGVVASLDSTARTFRLGGLLIDYSGVSSAALPAALANDQRLAVLLKTQAGPDGRWFATALRAAVAKLDDRPQADVRGTITAISSATAFELNGVKVDASQASFPDGKDGLALGARVEVEGALTNGVLLASKVEIDAKRPEKGRLELHGAIGNLNTVAKTFVLRGVQVRYDKVQTWKGGSETDLANGRKVEVKGALSADRRGLEAAEVSFEN
jgi:hypothetical protein